MNIFFLSIYPRLCVLQYADEHIVKMILETCQLLFTTIRVLQGEDKSWEEKCLEDTGIRPYRNFNPKHPCCIWARKKRANYMWLASLGYHMEMERRKRYPKGKPQHRCFPLIMWAKQNAPPKHLFENSEEAEDNIITPPALAMYNELKTLQVQDNSKTRIGKLQREETREIFRRAILEMPMHLQKNYSDPFVQSIQLYRRCIWFKYHFEKAGSTNRPKISWRTPRAQKNKPRWLN